MPDFVTVIKESRGVKGFVAAEVLTDDNGTDGYTTDTPFPVAGISEIAKTRDSTSEAHYYNNIPAIVITGESPDSITINSSLIPLDALAKITGQKYDATTGTLIEGERKVKYFAIGYITEDTNGDEVYVWRLKGTFNYPGETNSTKNDGTDANGQEIVYTGIQTVHEFAKNEDRGARAVNVEAAKDLVDLTNFFASVQTPDTITPKVAYTITIVQGESTNGFVTKGSELVTNATPIYKDETLLIHPYNSARTTMTYTVDGTVVETRNQLGNTTFNYTARGDTTITFYDV